MKRHNLKQSYYNRAWEDTKESFSTIWFFILVEIVAVGFFIFLATVLTPDHVGKVASALFQVIGGVAGLVVGPIVIFLFMFFRAPYVMHHETREQLFSEPKPIPLENRVDLIRIIHETETSSIALIRLRKAVVKKYDENPDDVKRYEHLAKATYEAEKKYIETLKILVCCP